VPVVLGLGPPRAAAVAVGARDRVRLERLGVRPFRPKDRNLRGAPAESSRSGAKPARPRATRA